MYDIVVVGGGPGGYAAALYAHNFGLSVALIERDRLGGTCLLRGCIPAKALIQSGEVYATVKGSAEFGVVTDDPTFDWSVAMARKTKVVEGLVSGLGGLLKSRGVEIIDGVGSLGGEHTVVVTHGDGSTTEVEARAIILATGSSPATIPGYAFDGTMIVSSDHALSWDSQPDRVAVIGAGVIGCEFASFLAEVGTEVHLFELEDQLVPGMEPEAAKVLERAFRRRGVVMHLGVGVGRPTVDSNVVVVPFGDDSVEVDVVLVAVGRQPQTAGINLEAVGLTTDRGYVEVDPATMRTTADQVYAVGDIVAGTPQLAHVAFAEAIAAVTHIATGEVAPVNYHAVPMVVYTHPEIAWVGHTEAAARTDGYRVSTSDHGMRGVGRAIIQGETGGMVKIVSEVDGQLLGATVAGPGAGEMIHELMYTVGFEALPDEAAAFIHAHPTISEAIGEALMASAGRNLH
ncbi:MAG: dihydrolipoyl dehydrogenase [Acidimicrobiia bacterium]